MQGLLRVEGRLAGVPLGLESCLRRFRCSRHCTWSFAVIPSNVESTRSHIFSHEIEGRHSVESPETEHLKEHTSSASQYI